MMTERELNEKKKEHLNGYKKLTRRVITLDRHLHEIRESKEQAKAVEYSDMPKGNKQTDLSDYIVELEEQEERINVKLDECKRKKIEIRNDILDVSDDLESDILLQRYVDSMSWEEIAEENGYSVRQILRYHGEALRHFKDVTECH